MNNLKFKRFFLEKKLNKNKLYFKNLKNNNKF